MPGDAICRVCSGVFMYDAPFYTIVANTINTSVAMDISTVRVIIENNLFLSTPYMTKPYTVNTATRKSIFIHC